jgi:hypothetical protein
MRILLIEDSWEDVADLYAEPLGEFRERLEKGEFRERLEKLNLEKLKEKLEPVEICWLVEINPRQGNAPTQEEIEKLRDLIQALRSGQIDNFPDPSRAEKIYRLLYPERNHDTERLLIADPGLERPIDSNFPFSLGFSGIGLYQKLVKTIMDKDPWDLIIADRLIPRIANSLHPLRKTYYDPDERYCNGVDLMVEYRRKHPECLYVVVSFRADQTFGVDFVIYGEPLILNNVNLYCPKQVMKNESPKKFRERLLDALNEALSFRFEEFISEEAKRIFVEYVDESDRQNALDKVFRQNNVNPAGKLFDKCPTLEFPFAKQIVRRVILGVYFWALGREVRGRQITARDITQDKLGLLCGLQDPENMGVYLKRYDLPLRCIRTYSFRPSEARWILKVFEEKGFPIIAGARQHLENLAARP